LKRKAALLTTTGANAEMEELVFALGADLVATFHQRRPQPDPQLFLGRGRMEQVREQLRATDVDLVVVNGQLKPGQIFGMQRFLAAQGEGKRERAGERRDEAGTVEVYDRTRLILEIFKERARSPEARLQVELAQLHYDMPLVKEAISLARKGERQAAMFGGGEYEVNQYHDTMKGRMARIRRDLEKMRRERGVRRKHRRRSGFHLVSLAGYTNAGKSSLLKALAREHTVVENRYFSTLSTKTARAQSDRRELLVTDTVGFIEGLPPWMVDAFHSTLEEIALADVIVLVVDASDPVPEMARRLRSSLRVLWEFDGGAAATGEEPKGVALATPPAQPWRRGLAPIVVALNKVDRLEPSDVDAKMRALEADGLLTPELTVAVSAQTGAGLQSLYERLYALIPDYDEYEVALPPSPEGEAFLSWLHERADILDLTRGNETHVHFEAKRSLRAELQERLRAAGAEALQEAVRGAEAGDWPSGTDSPSTASDATDSPARG
jgi:GTP-binding protein HflX